MKGYKYKLESLLKLRKFDEDKCKNELGQLQSEIARLHSVIEQERKYIANRH